MQQPRLVLADEPTSALDPSATQQACQALLAAAHQATLLSVVHDPALLPLLADRVIGLQGGQLVFDLPIGQLSADLLDQLYRQDLPTSGTTPVHHVAQHAPGWTPRATATGSATADSPLPTTDRNPLTA